MWDLPGGYMGEKESVEMAMKRELKEELEVNADLTFILTLPGTAYWMDKDFPILSHFFLADIGEQKIKLNDENSEAAWIDLATLKESDIAWDSNQAFASYTKENLTFDLERIKDLVSQLDQSAEVNEQYIYKAVLNGYVAKRYDDSKLIGMGWIFPLQTLLRKQAVVEDIICDEAYRRQGLGRSILQELVRWARTKGMDTIELTTNPKRIAANELYKSEGFGLHETNHYLLNLK